MNVNSVLLRLSSWPAKSGNVTIRKPSWFGGRMPNRIGKRGRAGDDMEATVGPEGVRVVADAGVIVGAVRFSCVEILETAAVGVAEVEATKVIGVSAGMGFGVSRSRTAGAETYRPKLSTIRPHAMRKSLLMFMGAL